MASTNGFNIHNYSSWNELIFRANMELSSVDLLSVRVFARSGPLTADISKDVWPSTGNRTLLTSASTMSIVSSSTNDAYLGTGAWYALIGGLDANYDIINETVVLSGTTPVVTTNSFIAINSFRTVYHGSTKSNAGNLTMTAVTGGSVQGYIAAGYGISQSSFLTIPNGYTAWTVDVTMSAHRVSGASGTREVDVDQMVYIPSANAVYRSIRQGIRTDGGVLVSSPQVKSQTPAKSTLYYSALSDTSNTEVTTSATYILVRGDYNYRTEI